MKKRLYILHILLIGVLELKSCELQQDEQIGTSIFTTLQAHRIIQHMPILTAILTWSHYLVDQYMPGRVNAIDDIPTPIDQDWQEVPYPIDEIIQKTLQKIEITNSLEQHSMLVAAAYAEGLNTIEQDLSDESRALEIFSRQTKLADAFQAINKKISEWELQLEWITADKRSVDDENARDITDLQLNTAQRLFNAYKKNQDYAYAVSPDFLSLDKHIQENLEYVIQQHKNKLGLDSSMESETKS